MAQSVKADLESQVRLWIEKNKKETCRLEFKLRVDLSTPGAKAEFVRDVIALSNSEGENPREDGHLVIGFKNGRFHENPIDHYDGATFGQILDSYIFPAVISVYEEFSLAAGGRISVLVLKPDPTALYIVNRELRDSNDRILLSPGQSWGRRSDRKVALSGEAIHARMHDISGTSIDAAVNPLKARIKHLEHQSGPGFEVRKIRFEMEANPGWPALEAYLQKLIPYAQEFDHVVKHEVLDAVMTVTGRTRQGMPHDVAQSVDSVLMEVMPVKSGGVHHPAREQFSEEDRELLERMEHITFEMTWDACRYLRDIKIVEVASRLYWVLIRFATLNRLKRLQSEALHNARYCRHICTEERMGKTFPGAHKQLGDAIADALDAFEYGFHGYSITIPSPKDVRTEEFAACIKIIEAGGAVDLASAQNELPRASTLAIVRKDKTIVGIGAIKRERRKYALNIAAKSGVAFPPETLELGYVAVSPEHRGNHLSLYILRALLKSHPGRVFATTFNAFMKDTLTSAGFENKGKEWKGRTQMLSFWDKE